MCPMARRQSPKVVTYTGSIGAMAAPGTPVAGTTLGFAASPVAASPGRINVPPEVFQKLAAGGSLTPQEMAQLSGQTVQATSPEKQQHGAGQEQMPHSVAPGSPTKPGGLPTSPSP